MLKKIWYVLTKKQKKRLFCVAIITFIGNIFETLGVSIILPFINAILTPDKLMNNMYLKPVLNALNITSAKLMVVLLALLIILLYWIKNIYLMFMYSVQYQFTYNNRRRLSNRLLQAYVKQPYLYHVEHNSAELIRNVSTDVDMFFTSVLQLLHLQTSGGMCFLLLCMLFYEDKTITLAVLICMGAFLVFYNKALKGRTQKEGENNRTASKDLQQQMMQVFQGIKEIKIIGKEKYFFKEYDRIYRRLARSNIRIQVYAVIPKPIMETICITGLFGIVALKVYRGVDLNYFIPTLAMFAVAAFKMFPAAAVITSSINSFNANRKSVEAVYGILKTLQDMGEEAEEETECEFSKKIELKNVTFRYPNTEQNVLNEVELIIEKDKSTAFIGASGGGKSTLINLILGLFPPNEGKILIDDTDIQSCTRKWQDKIGYIPQMIYLSDESIKKNIAYGLEDDEIDEDRVWEVIRSAQLESFVHELKDGIETEIGEAGVRLSGGQRQRIGIARALYNMPEVLVLDEATSALDTETEQAIMQTINALRNEKTLIIIAHRLSTIKDCDNIYKIENGKVLKTEVV